MMTLKQFKLKTKKKSVRLDRDTQRRETHTEKKKKHRQKVYFETVRKLWIPFI